MAHFRHLETSKDLADCVALQRVTWGDEFGDIVPASVLKVTQKIGGLLAGAFEGDRMVGFVYSFVGQQGETFVHWSHMLAVHSDARGQGLGRRLKLFQRAELLKGGIKTVYWTFDPLVARNAHLNVNRLGASVAGYIPNMYGSATGSPLHVGGDTDRCIARWDLDSARVRWAVEGEPAIDRPATLDDAPLVTVPDIGETVEDVELPETPSVRIEIPCDIASVAKRSPAEVEPWRLTVRRAFLTYLGRRYAVTSFYREAGGATCYYLLRRG
ncbi:MAG: GNAT family N-acetyltransferase [Gemmatimonadota bacterium]|nr:GNAT family N-acetyltransferase [Gemmatimonadota bacterium]